MLLWATVGIWIYVLVWFFVNITINIRNDVAVNGFIHPQSYKQSNFLANVLGIKVLLLLAVIVSVAYIVVGFRLMEELGQIFYLALANIDWVYSSAMLITAILASAVLLYVVTVLVRLVSNIGRAIYKGL